MTLSPRSYLLCSSLVASFVIGALWLYTSLMPMRFLEGGYPIRAAKQAILHGCGFGSVLIMGDSRPESAIIPLRLGLPAANISSGASTPIENFFAARQALKCPHPPRYVVYSQSLLSFTQASEFLWTNAARYGLISFGDLREIAKASVDVHDDTLAQTSTRDGLSGIVRDAVYSSGFPSIFTASLLKARGFGRYAANIALRNRTLITRGAVIYPDNPGNATVGVDAAVKRFVALPIQAYYFDKTMQLFAQAGVKVLYLPIPISLTTMETMGPAPGSDFDHFLERHTKQFPNVVVSYPTLTAWPDELFVDGSHMNERGATILSDRLAACLAQWQTARERPPRCDLSWK